MRLLLVADLSRLVVRHWGALEASLRTLRVEGFPSPELWFATAMLTGSIGIVTLLTGWRVRWGAAFVLLGFLPVAGVFSVTYVPTGWTGWMQPMLSMGAMLEDLLLGFALMGVFLFGAGTYTLTRGLRTATHQLRIVKQHFTHRGHSAPQQQREEVFGDLPPS